VPVKFCKVGLCQTAPCRVISPNRRVAEMHSARTARIARAPAGFAETPAVATGRGYLAVRPTRCLKPRKNTIKAWKRMATLERPARLIEPGAPAVNEGLLRRRPPARKLLLEGEKSSNVMIASFRHRGTKIDA
jgi:hypothetical protein